MPPINIGPITNADLETDASILIDFQQEGAPLIITFGFYDAAGSPQFNFYGRVKKLESITGQRFNKILLRDLDQFWYLAGIPGIGRDVDSTVAALRDPIARMAPSRIITMGQSMGAYGAILYGILLEVDHTISFGPLSCFDERILRLLNDTRWAPRVTDLAKIQSPNGYYDLATFRRDWTGRRPHLDVFYGTYPGPNAIPHDAIGPDAAHAIRFDTAPGVTLFPAHRSYHPVVEYFRSQGALTDILANRLLGLPLAPMIARLDTPLEWLDWIRLNIGMGCNQTEMRAAMAQQLTQESIESLFDRMYLIETLQEINRISSGQA